MRVGALLAAALAIGAGCEPSPTNRPGPASSRPEAPPPTAKPNASTPQAPVAPLITGPAPIDPNPLRLPPRRITLDPGKRIFAPSDQMLAGAKVGSTLVLYATTALGLDGDDVIVEGRGGPSYKVAASYVVPVPDEPKVKPGDPVITEHAGVLRHAVVKKLQKDKKVVRFTDVDAKMPEVGLKTARFIRQVEGLAPGNYAALRDGDAWRHVLLVSPFTEGAVKRWFAIGFGGAALKVDEASLRPIPIKWNPKVGATIWAENVGTMRKAIVVGDGEQGLFTVKYERTGRPAVIGWGMLMQPVD